MKIIDFKVNFIILPVHNEDVNAVIVRLANDCFFVVR